MLVPVLHSESDWGQITDKHQWKGLCRVYIAINQLALALLLQIHNSQSQHSKSFLEIRQTSPDRSQAQNQDTGMTLTKTATP